MPGRARYARQKIGVEPDRVREALLRRLVVFRRRLAHVPQAALIGAPRVVIVGRPAQRPVPFGVGDRWRDRGAHRIGDLVLNHEYVSEIGIIAVFPDVRPRVGLDQLRGDPDLRCDLTHAAFENISRAEVAPDPLHIDVHAFIGERRIAGDDEQ